MISGLPRSGSTLLCNILAQNPDIHTTPTSACHEALFVLRNVWGETKDINKTLASLSGAWGEWVEHRAAIEISYTLGKVLDGVYTAWDYCRKHNIHEYRAILCVMEKAIMEVYHDTDRPVIIDKGRGWLSLIELAELALDRKAKIIVPVRGIPQILSSFEKLHRSTHKKDQGNYFQAQTMQGRAEHLLAGDQVFGLAYNRLKDAMMRGLGDRLCLVEFDDLTHNPKETLEDIYKFLELPNFKHDFTNVEQYTHEDDSVHGMNLHTIRKKVKPIKDDSHTVLGADLVKQYTGTEFWRK